MQKEFKNILKLFLAISTVLIFYSLARVYFYVPNRAFFQADINFNLLTALNKGFINDFKFIFSLNSIIILMFFLPLRIRNTVFWQFIVKLSFALVNMSLILFYLLDSKYFQSFNEHIKLYGNTDLSIYKQIEYAIKEIGLELSQYWGFIFIALFILLILWLVFPSINKMYFERSRTNLLFRFSLSLAAIFIFWNAYVQLKDNPGRWPMELYQKMNRSTSTLAINSPYYLMRNYYAKPLKTEFYFNSDELKTLHSVEKKYVSRIKNKRNVWIINSIEGLKDWKNIEQRIKKLEMNYFSAENYNSEGFGTCRQLDELMLSFPAFGTEALMQSIFAFNQFQCLPDVLNKNGYHTIFASNSTQDEQNKSFTNFYGFSTMIYHPQHHRLFVDVEKSVSQNTQESHLVFFQLSSGLDELLSYIKDNQLYEKSLIVINLNSTKQNLKNSGKTVYILPDSIDKYLIPDKTQNIDLMPSILDYLNLNLEFISFGQSVFFNLESKEVFHFADDDYMIFKDSLLLRYNGETTKWLVDYKNDAEEFFDLQDSLPVQKVRLENKIRALMQENNQRLIKNRMLPMN